MYWSRTGSFFDIAMWLLLCSTWWTGGWLLSTHLFQLRLRERLFTGFGFGMVLFIIMSNLFGLLLNLTLAYWAAAASILIAGLAAVFGSTIRPELPMKDFSRSAGQIIGFVGLLIFFVLVNRGLAIFDDNNNLPLVSQIAAGDFPPHFYLDSAQRLDYHYGLHLFAASLVRLGGLYPWSAFDLSKAISLSILLILTWLWFRRMVRPKYLALLGVLFVLLATGTRWMMLLIPERILIEISSDIHLTGSALSSGPELYQALISPWKMEGGSPFPFPFAFANGIIPPTILSMTGYGAMPQLTLVLFLLLMRKTTSTFRKVLLGLVLSSLAITGEHLFVMLWSSVFIAVLGRWLVSRPLRRSFSNAAGWGWVLLPSLLVALTGGGVLTEFVRRISSKTGGSDPIAGIGFSGISLRIPPGLISAHLGKLSITHLRQMVVALAEIGPIILLAVPVFYLGWKRFRYRDWSFTVLGIAAAIGLIFPFVIQLTLRDRDISRMTGIAMFILVVLGFPLSALAWKRSANFVRGLLFSAYLLAVFGGTAILPSLLVAVAQPQPSYFISTLDGQMSQTLWDKLEEDAVIFDPAYSSRPPTLFARSVGRAYQDIYTPFPDYETLLKDPDPQRAARAGYTHYYLDRDTWQKLPVELQSTFQLSCMVRFKEFTNGDGDFRTLFDIRHCQD